MLSLARRSFLAARLLLMVMIANGITDAARIQAAFDVGARRCRGDCFATFFAESGSSASDPKPAMTVASALATTRLAGQDCRMDDLHWIWPDRCDLYHACRVLSDPQAKTANVSEAAETVLNDLELFDDPHQGRGAWLFDDEMRLASDLATKLHALAGLETSGDWGEAIMGHELWPAIVANAGRLLKTIERNGQGSAKGVH